MRKTNFKQRHDALKEWKSEALIQGLPKNLIERVEKDFFEKDKMIRRWEEEAQAFREMGEKEEADLSLDEAHEIHNELLDLLSIKKFAA